MVTLLEVLGVLPAERVVGLVEVGGDLDRRFGFFGVGHNAS
jgi:hypothetical protein